MQSNDEFLAKWEHIIEEVNKTEVPLECIKKVIIKLAGRKRKTINLENLRRQGLNEEDLETVLSRTLEDLGRDVVDVDFVVDVTEVAKLAQPVTDQLLQGLK